MALSESKTIDKIEIVGDFKSIQVREATIIYRFDEEISRLYDRKSYQPGDDISEAPEEVKQLAALFWTEELVEAFKASIATPVTIVEELE